MQCEDMFMNIAEILYVGQNYACDLKLIKLHASLSKFHIHKSKRISSISGLNLLIL